MVLFGITCIYIIIIIFNYIYTYIYHIYKYVYHIHIIYISYDMHHFADSTLLSMMWWFHGCDFLRLRGNNCEELKHFLNSVDFQSEKHRVFTAFYLGACTESFHNMN